MSSLAHPRPRVHSKFEVLPDRDPTPPEDLDGFEPFMSPEDCFHPSPTDEAWHIAFNAADQGDDPDFPEVSAAIRPEVYLAHCKGKLAGRIAREVRDAREIGFTLGYAGSASEPPKGYLPHQAKAYREGHQDAQRELIAEAQEEAMLDSWIAEREREAFTSGEIQDCDVWPMGYMS